MRNLKRALSVALAAVMLLGMMVIGAGAASINDFADKDEIVNQDAVALMVDLGVIEGYQGANGPEFGPNNTLQRSALAKIAYMVATGSNDWTLYVDSKNPVFNDIKGNWAEGAIEYCTMAGFISGVGDGAYAPDGLLTVAATAKTLLCALGYEAASSGYNGDQWAIRAMADAKANGLLDGLTNAQALAYITRDDACRMAYNALFAETVTPVRGRDEGEWYVTKYDPTGKTLGEDSFKLVANTGILVANEFATLTTANAAKGQSTIKTTSWDDTNKVYAIGAEATVKLPGATDLLGHEVVYYTFKGNGMSSSLVATGLTKTSVMTKTSTPVYADGGVVRAVNYVKQNGAAAASIGDTLVDSNADGKIDYALLTNYTFGQVTDVNTAKGTISIPGFGTRKIADVKGAETLKKGDYVNYAIVGGDVLLEAASSVYGTVSAIKAGKMIINGTAYTASAVSGLAGISGTAYQAGLGTTYKWSDPMTFYMDKAGNIVIAAGEAAAAATVNYAVITAGNVTKNWQTGAATVEVQATLADGTIGVFNLVDDDPKTDNASLYDEVKDIAGDFVTNNKSAVLGVYAYTLTQTGDMVISTKTPVAPDTVKADFNLQANKADALNTTNLTSATKTVAMTANTKFLIVYKNALGVPVAESYTGIANIPTVPMSKGDSTASPAVAADNIVVVPDKTGNTAAFVYVNKAPIGKASDAKYLYVADTTATTTATGTAYTVIVDGAEETITLAAPKADLKVGQVYSYTVDSKTGLATLADATITQATVTDLGANYFLDETNTQKNLADSCTVDDLSNVDNKGNIMPGVGTLAVGSNIVYVADQTSGQVTKIYVLGKGSSSAPDTTKLDLDGTPTDVSDVVNAGVTVTVVDQTIYFNGTLGQYTGSALDDFMGGADQTSGGYFISATLNAPAGVAADGSDGAIHRTIVKTAANGQVTETPADDMSKPVEAGKNTVTVLFSVGKPSDATAKYAVKVTVDWTDKVSSTYTLDFSGMTWAE